jgi:hypothetical protein
LTEDNARAESERRIAQSEAEIADLRKQTGEIFEKFPSLLRLQEFEMLGELAKNANARIFLGVDKDPALKYE